MAKQEQKYVDAIATFTDSLDAIVQLLQSQKSNDTADVIVDFLKTPMNELVSVVKDLQKVTIQGFAKQENRNKVILEEIKSIKKQRESGMFENVEDPKNKNKIVDGIKVVILIAAGVLALGLAFKIIGKVDFLSVMALSSAMLLMSIAFSKMQDQKMDIMKVIKISAILPIMAVGLALSGFFLKNFPEFSLRQGLSILLIGGALGLATFLLLKAIDKLSIKSLFMVPFIVLILPLIALGLVKASSILKGMQTISPMQILSVGLVGLALGVAMYAISFSMKHMKGITFPQVLMFTAMIPLIALGLVLASQILQDFQPINNPLGLLKGSVVIGLAVLAVSFSVVLIGRFLKGKEKDLAIGIIGAIAVAGAIVSISYIFKALPTELNAPDMMWSLKVGLSILIFSSIAVLIAIMMNATLSMGYGTGSGAGGSIGGSIGGSMKALGVGVLAVVAIAATIVIVSQIFRLFATDSPVVDPMWSLGVGLSILLLSVPVILIGTIISSGVGAIALGLGLLALPLIALSMVAVQAILGLATWSDNYPKSDWALGVGTSLILFATASILAAPAALGSAVMKFLTGEDPLVKISKSMISVAKELSSFDWKSANYPTKEWSLGVGTALALFATAYATIMALEGVGRVFTFLTGGGKSKSFNEFVLSAADTMVTARDKIDSGNWSTKNYPSKEFAEGVGGLLVSMAKAYAIVVATEGFNKIINFFSGKSDTFTVFVENAAHTMVTARNILTGVDWSSAKFPSKAYSEGVGQFLISMAEAYSKLNDRGFFGTIAAILGVKQMPLKDFVVDSATALKLTSDIWSKSDFSKYPSEKYINAFSYFIISISDLIQKGNFNLNDTKTFNTSMDFIVPAIEKLSKLPIINDSMIKNMKNIKETLIELASAVDGFMYETPGGAIGLFNAVAGTKSKRSMSDFILFSSGLITLISGLQMLNTLKTLPSGLINGYSEFFGQLKNMPELKAIDQKAQSINNLANSFLALANSLTSVNANLSGFNDLSRGLFLISIIDDAKFNNVLKTVDKYKGTLQVINQVPTEQSNLLSTIKGLFEAADSNKGSDEKSENKKSETTDDTQKKFYKDISDIKSMLYEFKDLIDKPSQAGSFNK